MMIAADMIFSLIMTFPDKLKAKVDGKQSAAKTHQQIIHSKLAL